MSKTKTTQEILDANFSNLFSDTEKVFIKALMIEYATDILYELSDYLEEIGCEHYKIPLHKLQRLQ